MANPIKQVYDLPPTSSNDLSLEPHQANVSSNDTYCSLHNHVWIFESMMYACHGWLEDLFNGRTFLSIGGGIELRPWD